MLIERCDWYDELFDVYYEPPSVGVGDRVWLGVLADLGKFANGEILSVDKERELVIVGVYGRYSYDPHFTEYQEVDLSDFENWGECKDGKSGRRWILDTFLT